MVWKRSGESEGLSLSSWCRPQQINSGGLQWTRRGWGCLSSGDAVQSNGHCEHSKLAIKANVQLASGALHRGRLLECGRGWGWKGTHADASSASQRLIFWHAVFKAHYLFAPLMKSQRRRRWPKGARCLLKAIPDLHYDDGGTEKHQNKQNMRFPPTFKWSRNKRKFWFTGTIPRDIFHTKSNCLIEPLCCIGYTWNGAVLIQYWNWIPGRYQPKTNFRLHRTSSKIFDINALKML